MGMDLSHDKATLEKTGRYLLLDRLETLDVPVELFRPYLQPIPQMTVFKQVLMIKDTLFGYLKAREGYDDVHAFPGPDKELVLTKPQARLEKQIIARYARQHPDLEVDLGETYDYQLSRGQYRVISFGKEVNYPGIYLDHAGDQRNGMLGGFVTRFPAENSYWRKADMVRILNEFVDPDVQDHFRNAFVDNFEEGCSLFSYCY
ncbi:MAG: hypothetical protein ACAI44_40385 [Candidatus Sericytochromatia bacterium]